MNSSFVIVMPTAVCDKNAISSHVVNETVFVVDPAAKFALKIIRECFGFSDP